MRRLTTATVAAAFLAAAVATPPTISPAAASETCDGVWVIVDATALGGSVEKGCAQGSPSSGLAALEAAGFSYEFVPRQPGLVCRIQGRPDPCNNAPTDAYWAYWHAETGGSWTYSNRGAGNRVPPKGSVDGWAFGAGAQPSMAPPAPPPPPPDPEPEPEPEPEPDPDPDPEPGSDNGDGASGSDGSSGSGTSSRSGPSSGSGGASGSEGAQGSSGPGSDGTGSDPTEGGPAAPSGGETDGDPVADADAEDGGRRASASPSADRQAQGLLTEDTDDQDASRAGEVEAGAAEAGNANEASRDGDDPGDRLASRQVEAGGGPPIGIIAAGSLLAAMAGLGALQRRKRSEA